MPESLFELSTGAGRKTTKILCAYKDGELYSSPRLIGMSDTEAMVCVTYDGLPCLMTGKYQVLVSVAWMMKEKPSLADDLQKFVDMAHKATSSEEGA
jgi:hypothetical protein